MLKIRVINIVFQFQCRNVSFFQFRNFLVVLKNDMKDNGLIIFLFRMFVQKPVGRFYMKFSISEECDALCFYLYRMKIRTSITI